MKIVNPLYDKAFKYLMENELYARKVLSVILDREVLSVHLSQQETVFEDEQKKLSLFILDFHATIRQKDGQQRAVLIELQKSKYMDDIRRFRNYLGSQYLSRKQPPEATPALPIITIYILGYPLEGNPYLAVRSSPTLTDATTHEPVEIRDDFLKYLSHESYLIQVMRLPQQRRTRMERFFMLFNQAWMSEECYVLDLEEVPEEFVDVAQYLNGQLRDEDFRRQLELESQVTHEWEQWEQKLQAAEELAEEERKQKEEAQQKEQASRMKMVQLIRHLSGSMSLEEIAEATQLSIEEVKELLGK